MNIVKIQYNQNTCCLRLCSRICDWKFTLLEHFIGNTESLFNNFDSFYLFQWTIFSFSAFQQNNVNVVFQVVFFWALHNKYNISSVFFFVLAFYFSLYFCCESISWMTCIATNVLHICIWLFHRFALEHSMQKFF